MFVLPPNLVSPLFYSLYDNYRSEGKFINHESRLYVYIHVKWSNLLTIKIVNPNILLLERFVCINHYS